MSDKTKYYIGLGTIVAILGITAASIVMYRKQKKADEESMNLEEARELIKETYGDKDLEEVKHEITHTSPKVIGETGATKEDFDKSLKKLTDAVLAKELEEEMRLEEIQRVEEELKEPELEQEPVYLIDEGEGKLRHDPNSDEALIQYMKMELADWTPKEEEYTILLRLFDVIFEPIVTGDKKLYSTLELYRGEFFGFKSRWVDRVSFADVILHYSRYASYNVGGSVKDWANTFIRNVGLEYCMSEEDLIFIFEELNTHRPSTSTFESEHAIYGLFGLDEETSLKAVAVANKTPEVEMSYDIEFNEFLKLFNN